MVICPCAARISTGKSAKSSTKKSAAQRQDGRTCLPAGLPGRWDNGLLEKQRWIKRLILLTEGTRGGFGWAHRRHPGVWLETMDPGVGRGPYAHEGHGGFRLDLAAAPGSRSDERGCSPFAQMSWPARASCEAAKPWHHLAAASSHPTLRVGRDRVHCRGKECGITAPASSPPLSRTRCQDFSDI